VRRGLIKQEQRRIPQEQPGQRDLLALPGGEGVSALSKRGVVPTRQPLDEFRRPG
jgi:hypothetical protein